MLENLKMNNFVAQMKHSLTRSSEGRWDKGIRNSNKFIFFSVGREEGDADPGRLHLARQPQPDRCAGGRSCRGAAAAAGAGRGVRVRGGGGGGGPAGHWQW